jgi:lipoprotein NlpD
MKPFARISNPAVWHLLPWVAAMMLAGCASKHPLGSAPVEDKGTYTGKSQPGVQTGVITTVTPAPVKLPPGYENAGKPGYYTVKPGDTLIRIGLETGQGWKDISRWNNLENPNLIEVGQTIRVVPPTAAMLAAASAAPAQQPQPAADANGTVVRPLGSTATGPVSTPAAATRSASVTPAPVPAPTPAVVAPEEFPIVWPTQGAVVATFDDVKNKGIDIAGKAGDPVYAVADGQVIHAGSALRGYGNLVIIKHNNLYLTAYAHNQTLLVKEDQQVKKGQKIAEMGQTDTDRVKLHFELRRQGKPVDPQKYLPAK